MSFIGRGFVRWAARNRRNERDRVEYVPMLCSHFRRIRPNYSLVAHIQSREGAREREREMATESDSSITALGAKKKTIKLGPLASINSLHQMRAEQWLGDMKIDLKHTRTQAADGVSDWRTGTRESVASSPSASSERPTPARALSLSPLSYSRASRAHIHLMNVSARRILCILLLCSAVAAAAALDDKSERR